MSLGQVRGLVWRRDFGCCGYVTDRSECRSGRLHQKVFTAVVAAVVVAVVAVVVATALLINLTWSQMKVNLQLLKSP